MPEEKEKRRKRSSGEPEHTAAPKDLKTGDILRQARIAKGLELEEISSAIHVRVGQLKAIEENHIESLPGMTYALGFVKSYASYLKLDAAELATRFKAEHGAVQPVSRLQSTEAFTESKMPDPFMLGAAGLGVVVLIIAWADFSSGSDTNKQIVDNIPPAPVVTETAATAPAAAPASNAPENIPTGPLGALTPVQRAGDAAVPAAMPPANAAVDTATPAAETPAAATTTATATGVTSPLPHQKPADATVAQTQPAAGAATPAADGAQTPPADDVINIKRANSRVILHAAQTTWVKVTDGHGHTVFQSVLRPGDTYYVPEGSGYQLVTSNAGGLDVAVDGSVIHSLGGSGDIVRGVSLNPDSLKNQRSRSTRSNFQE